MSTHSLSLHWSRIIKSDPCLRKTVLLLALPAVGEQMLNMLVGLTDSFLVGHLDPAVGAAQGYDRATALASVGLGNMVSWISTVLFMSIAIGATTVVARRIGAGEHERAALALRQAMLLALIAGLLGTTIATLGAAPLMQLLGASPEVAFHGSQYLSIVALAFTPASLMFAITASLRGAGDTRMPLLMMGLVNGINIVLSWLLVNGNLGFPAMGIRGAALGSAIGQTTGSLALLGLLLAGRLRLPLSLDLRPHWQTMRAITSVGMPAAGEQFLFQAALLIVTPLITGLSTVAYAAHTMTITIESLSFLPGMGFAVASTTLVGQALGAGDPRRAQQSAYEALRLGGLMMGAAGLALFLWPAHFFGLMTSDPAIVEAGTLPLRFAGIGQIFLAFSFILNGALRGAGDTRWALVTRLISTWAVRMPLALVLVGWLGYGLGAIWLAMLADFVAQGLLALWRFQEGKWQTIKV